MIIRLGCFLFSLLCVPTTATAAIVNIEYSAHVYATTGDGLGYAEGDLFSGKFVIDTSKVQGKAFEQTNENEVWYYGSLSSGMLQSNFMVGSDSDYIDYLRIQNDPDFDDEIILDKVINAYGSTLESMGIHFRFAGLDWISDLSLNNINLISNEGGYSNGGFVRIDMNDWSVIDSANFWLDSLTIVSSSTDVSEPAPFILLAIGLAGLLTRRRAT